MPVVDGVQVAPADVAATIVASAPGATGGDTLVIVTVKVAGGAVATGVAAGAVISAVGAAVRAVVGAAVLAGFEEPAARAIP
jgi:hypothetical protein